MLGSGDTATVELPIRRGGGWVGVSISTANTPLYAEVIQRGSGSGGGGLDVIDALSSMQALIAGVGIMLFWMVVSGWHVMRREGGHPEVA